MNIVIKFKEDIYLLVALHNVQGLSSPTRDWTSPPCSESTDSQPLDCQESPNMIFPKPFDGCTAEINN